MPRVSRQPIGEVDHRARARCCQRRTGAQAGLGLQLARPQPVRSRPIEPVIEVRALEQEQPRTGAPQRAGDHERIPGPGACPGDERFEAVAVADRRDRKEQDRSGCDVPASDRDAGPGGRVTEAVGDPDHLVLGEVVR